MNSVVRSFEIKDDARVGPTCIVTMERGVILHFRICEGQLKKVVSTGVLSREDYRSACAFAGSRLREHSRQKAKLAGGKPAANRQLWYQEAD